MPKPESNSAGGAIPSLDGVRALAVGLVFLAHSGLGWLVPGGLGVTIFFVLSGYLITTLLRQEYARDGRISLRNFYLRRALRLMPPLLLVVALATALSALSLVDGAFRLRGLAAVLLYYGNYDVIFHDFRGLPAGMGVAWSLAVEEHYYLMYPPLALLLLRSGRPRRSAALLGVACLGVLLRRFWLAGHGADESYIGMATDTRIDSILIGCLMGLAQNPWLDRRAPPRGRALLVAPLCLGLLLASVLYRDQLFRLSLRYTVQSLAVAPLLWLAITRSGSKAFRWLQSPVPVYLGQISYSIYLSHHLLLELVRRQWPHAGWAATALLAAALTLLFAEAIRRWIERPCMALRRNLRRAGPQAETAIPAVVISS